MFLEAQRGLMLNSYMAGLVSDLKTIYLNLDNKAILEPHPDCSCISLCRI